MDSQVAEASPMKAVAEELDLLRKDFRSALETYAARIEEEIAQVQTAVQGITSRKKISASRLRDLRDMLTLLRKFQIKPEKGRRKDLKKIDSLIGDLMILIEHW
jgi:uncharacterized protein YfkK (UPF0435 family)